MRVPVMRVAGLVIIAMCCPTLGAESGALVPLEQFTRSSEFGAIRISPDGQYLAVSGGKNSSSLLEFYDIRNAKITAGLRFDNNFQIDDFYWISPTRLIYTLAERQLSRATPVATGEMISVDRNGQNQKFIYGYRMGEMQLGTRRKVKESSYATAELITLLRDDPEHILIAEHPWRERSDSWTRDRDAALQVVRLDVSSGEKQRVGSVPLAEATVLVDREQRVRVATGLDHDQHYAVVWKSDPGGPWTVLSLPGFRDESVEPRLFGKDNQSLYFTGTRDTETYTALYRMDLNTSAITRVDGFEDMDVNDVVLDFTRENVVGIVGYGERLVYHWLDDKDRAARVYSALARALPGQSVRVTSVSEDGHYAVAEASSDVNPGDYYLFDTQSLKASYLQSSMGGIEPARMRSKEPFTFKARDGMTLHGYLTRPSGPGPYPTVVLPHGGPHFVRDYWEFDPEVQLLASRGYAVLQVNFRGSGGYGHDFARAGYREWGARMQDDVTDATHWAIDQKVASPQGICIYGASYGGYAALMGVVREPALYRCAIGYAGIYDLELMLTSADIPESRAGRTYLQDTLGSDHEQLRERSPVAHARDIQVPVLLIHGTNDWRVDFTQATHMKAALDASHRKFEWMKLSREGHGAYDEQTRLEVYERILGFLDANIGPGQTRQQASQATRISQVNH